MNTIMMMLIYHCLPCQSDAQLRMRKSKVKEGEDGHLQMTDSTPRLPLIPPPPPVL